jgi:formylglycine-generating enzyme required for sulfatase activity
LVVLLVVVLVLTLRQGTLVIEIDEQLGKDVQVAASQGGRKIQVADARSGWTLSLDAGKYDLAVQGGDDHFQLDSENVTVTRGGQVKVRVTLKQMNSLVPLAGEAQGVKAVSPAIGPDGKWQLPPGAPPPAIAPFDAAKAKEHQEFWAKHLGTPVEITNSIGMKLVLIPPGDFDMGSSQDLIAEELKAHRNDRCDPSWYMQRLPCEAPKHRVRITRPFYLGVYMVTQGEYERVMGTNPSDFSATCPRRDDLSTRNTERFPVDKVSWADAAEFCRKLSDLPAEKAVGRCYRLPTEAQWEYACRAGSSGRFGVGSGRNDVSREKAEQDLFGYGWFLPHSGGTTHVVGGKQPSPWGLYDICGQLWEWCQDWYEANYYEVSPVNDPRGPPSGLTRVLRGGSWGSLPYHCRPALRYFGDPRTSSLHWGMRIALLCGDS